ncbi:amino acid permease [Lysobacter claricitrinus]|uniref:amino acid permease n=1 Tax=Lysobacter claricitrinus TaxID=3367728 RepID=UPI0037DACA2E
MSTWLRRKDIDRITVHEEGRRLVRTLSWPHLVALGIGAIVGTGIYTLVGVAANLAGPAVLLSFVVAGVVCACAALAYAEMATMMPAAGSAYTYSYAVLGESIAWVVGWSLILEYSLVVSAVAVGWSGSVVEFLQGLGVALPHALIAGPHAGGIVNLPAVLIVFVVAGLLMVGTRESATLNAALVAVKVVALGVFVAIAMPHFDAGNLHPFMPYGFVKAAGADGVERGVMAAAAIIFFAFYGFDAISTAAEEAKNPGRDLSIGIVGSMIGCTLIYLLVAVAAVGAMHYTVFAQSPAPLALIMRELGQGAAAKIVAGAAVVALPTVLLAFFYGQSRIFFVMSRDGLFPRALSKVNPRTGTPVAITLFTAVIVAALAGVARLDEIAALANAGTLAAFVAVAACLLVLRVRDPQRARVFRTPAAWIVGPIAILGCLYLFYSLPHRTQYWFLIWNAIGVAVYLLFGRRGSVLARGEHA